MFSKKRTKKRKTIPVFCSVKVVPDFVRQSESPELKDLYSLFITNSFWEQFFYKDEKKSLQLQVTNKTPLLSEDLMEKRITLDDNYNFLTHPPEGDVLNLSFDFYRQNCGLLHVSAHDDLFLLRCYQPNKKLSRKERSTDSAETKEKSENFSDLDNEDTLPAEYMTFATEGQIQHHFDSENVQTRFNLGLSLQDGQKFMVEFNLFGQQNFQPYLDGKGEHLDPEKFKHYLDESQNKIYITDPKLVKLFFFSCFINRSFSKDILVPSIYGLGRAKVTDKIREKLNSPEFENFFRSLFFYDKNNRFYPLADFPHFGFTEQTITGLTQVTQNAFKNAFPLVVACMDLNKNIGKFCYLNELPVIYYAFSGLNLGGLSLHYNEENPERLKVRLPGRKEPISASIYKQDPSPLKLEITYSKLPENVDLAKGVTPAAGFIHHLDAMICVSIALSMWTHTIHDSFGCQAHLLAIVESLYSQAFANIEKEKPLQKFICMNLQILCPQIDEMVKTLGKNPTFLEVLLYPVPEEKNLRTIVLPETVNITIDKISINGLQIKVPVNQKKILVPENLELHLLTGLFEEVRELKQEFDESTDLDLTFLQSSVNETAGFNDYVVNQLTTVNNIFDLSSIILTRLEDEQIKSLEECGLGIGQKPLSP